MRTITLIAISLVVTMMTAGGENLFPRIEHETIDDQPYEIGGVLYEDDFSGNLLNWRAEGDIMPKITDGRMECETKTGLTTWFKTKLSGDIMIEYDRQVWAGGGPNDHSRDVNCFWMALDPTHPNDFWARSNWRDGMFKNYGTLRLYYVGYGGGNNTTCRFRRYTGLADPPPPPPAIHRRLLRLPHRAQPRVHRQLQGPPSAAQGVRPCVRWRLCLRHWRSRPRWPGPNGRSWITSTVAGCRG